MPRIKRLTAPHATEKKRYRFVTAARGPHKRTESLSMLTVLRDKLGLAESAKEARRIAKGRMVKIDGKIVTDLKRGAGVFDVIEVGGKTYRVVPRKRLELIEAEPGSKMVQIIGKTAVVGGKIQLNLNDGKNILLEKNAYKVLDSLLISLPEQKVLEHIPLESGVLVLITKGTHSGKVAKLIDIERKRKRVWLGEKGKKFEAPLYGVVAIGKDKPLIGLGE